jgi:hypothetical protein
VDVLDEEQLPARSQHPAKLAQRRGWSLTPHSTNVDTEMNSASCASRAAVGTALPNGRCSRPGRCYSGDVILYQPVIWTPGGNQRSFVLAE